MKQKFSVHPDVSRCSNTFFPILPPTAHLPPLFHDIECARIPHFHPILEFLERSAETSGELVRAFGLKCSRSLKDSVGSLFLSLTALAGGNRWREKETSAVSPEWVLLERILGSICMNAIFNSCQRSILIDVVVSIHCLLLPLAHS